jgi:hypothetical protein
LVTHPEIAPGQARLALEFFAGGLPEKKVYLGGMSILSILLSLESGCHTGPVSGLTWKKKRREEENRKWAGWRMRPKKLFGI